MEWVFVVVLIVAIFGVVIGGTLMMFWQLFDVGRSMTGHVRKRRDK